MGGSVGGVGFDNSRRWRPERCQENVWLTPEWLLQRVRHAFGGTIDLDPCTIPSNPCAARQFITAPDDGLMLPWNGTVWCNPPFSAAALAKWVDKAYFEAGRHCRVLLLLPSRPETSYGQRALRTADAVVFLSERVAFEGMTRDTAVPCTLFAYGVDIDAFADVGVSMQRHNRGAA